MTSSTKMHYPDATRRVLSVLEQHNTAYELRSYEVPAHHAVEAAALLGSPLGAVVKSLVFQNDSEPEMILVLVSGENRVNVSLLNNLVKGSCHQASPDSVQEEVGYPVGAVPPFGLKRQFSVFVDRDLMAYELVWGSAGSINVLLGIPPNDLVKLSLGRVEQLKSS